MMTNNNSAFVSNHNTHTTAISSGIPLGHSRGKSQDKAASMGLEERRKVEKYRKNLEKIKF